MLVHILDCVQISLSYLLHVSFWTGVRQEIIWVSGPDLRLWGVNRGIRAHFLAEKVAIGERMGGSGPQLGDLRRII